MEENIGQKIKELRVSKKITLKDLSKKTGLSIAFLSQLERGLTSAAIMSLKNIAEALEVDISYFFAPPFENSKRVIRSYEQEIFHIENSKFIYYNLANDAEGKALTPFLVTIYPERGQDQVIPYAHEGEEFIYVLEGILTLYLENEKYDLYPGDSLHIDSSVPHNWANFTNKVVKILSVNTPKIFEIKKPR
ncbi:helix-turn-helix domain-containing protein [Geosporobacter ferrireducens]|uniref:helix-turn-helix domain-containing protein n=1 Tax=Geosporobacter ferrireducens TaxID=1424294 RepID=UPI00139AE3FD|nr:XRE family transcriptional regulator [Geosporobacter ferrireducens]MTI55942.1 cupin domain-containing protein [Geosporobacter ferrireducens]